MSSVDDTLAEAKRRHEAGDLAGAEVLYRRVLRADETCCEALYLLGAACFALNKTDEAVAHLEHSVRLQPDFVEGHNYLGALYGLQLRADEAVASLERAQRLAPDSAEIQRNLRRAQAAQLSGRGLALMSERQLAEAGTWFERAIAHDAEYVDAYNNLGLLRLCEQRADLALPCFQRAVELMPEFSDAWRNLAAVHELEGRLTEAADSWQRLVALTPDDAAARVNLGTLLLRLDQALAAEPHFCRALALEPDNVLAHRGLALVLTDTLRLDAALAHWRRAVELQPDLAEAHFNLSLLHLARGDYAAGWPEYEWRWQHRGHAVPALAVPRWTGSPLTGRTILVHGEQGLGDALQFLRFVPLLEQRGAKVIVTVHAPLVPLVQQSGYEHVFPLGSLVEEIDCHIPLASLPGVFGTTVDTIPRQIPYLSADSRLIEHWRAMLGPRLKFRVGIVWRGSPTYVDDRKRSVPLEQFAPLAQDGVELISLQQGSGSQELASWGGPFAVRDLGEGVDRENGPFQDTAAIMMNLDLVVSVDSAPVHLAGALGVPVWVPLRHAPDWRWLLERDDSPWYPTARLFRQSEAGNWASVFERMAAALVDLVHAARKPDRAR